jgi:hypothetical protein
LYKSAKVKLREARLGRLRPGMTAGKSSEVGTALTKTIAQTAAVMSLNKEIMFDLRYK